MDKPKVISTYGKEKIVADSFPFYFFLLYFLSVTRHCANEADGQRYTLKTVRNAGMSMASRGNGRNSLPVTWNTKTSFFKSQT